LLASLIYVIIIPLFTFYFLNDYPKITGWFKNLVPPRHRDNTMVILGEVDGVLAGFIRGQLTICAILAILYSILLSIVGVPAGITIGIIAGLFNLVPYLGTATGLLLSCLFLLLEGSAWSGYLAVGLIFVAVSTADGLFLTPRILGQKLGLAPVAVILAVLAFGEVFGFLGVLIAVPVTAIGKVLGKRALEVYRQSKTYKGSSEAHEEDQARSQ
jgi:predicted PurR-regulated permease PerM